MHLPFRTSVLSILIFSMFSVGVCFAQTTERVSVDSQGVEGNYSSILHATPAISADGRYVAFGAAASNLVPGDTNGVMDIFIHDRQIGVTERVSVGSQGVEGNGGSYSPSISADGRYVAFWSTASNLVSQDMNVTADVFVHDRQTGVTERVSVDSQGVEVNSACTTPSISADGRYVSFESWAHNLVPGDTNGGQDIFVHDRQTGATERASVNTQGGQGWNGLSFSPSISADGHLVVFTSSASNLVPGGTRGQDIFVHDLRTRATKRVSVNTQGVQGNGSSWLPSISADGRYVAFGSAATNLVPGDTNGWGDIFIRDLQIGTTERVSVDSQGVEGSDYSSEPSVSADGRYVAFRSISSNLVPGDANGDWDVFVHDRQAGVTERVSVDSQGVEGNFSSYEPSISADGRYIAFDSYATNLAPGDTNGWRDVFVHDRWNGLGANSIYLSGPATAPIGVPLELAWATARPNSKYWLAYSKNTNGFVISGHAIDLGLFFTVMATGSNTSSGTGSFTSTPIPPRAAGSTLYFEVLARDANGILYDSNALAIDFN